MKSDGFFFTTKDTKDTKEEEEKSGPEACGGLRGCGGGGVKSDGFWSNAGEITPRASVLL